MVQVFPANSVPGFPHVVAGLREYGLPTASDKMFSVTAWVFLRVTVLAGELVSSTTTLPKFTEIAESVVCALAIEEENKQNSAVSERLTIL
jgi:hypothetical protein